MGRAFPTWSAPTSSPSPSDGRIRPVMVDGVAVMSIGFFVPPGEAVIWRGPMLHSTITQFLRDTDWGDLDYLIVDMPPGTGDVALTLSQLLPLSGAVVVCTPQDVALLDVTKAIAMFRKVDIELLGMVENMSYFLCPDCGSRHEIFGSGGAKRRAEELGVPFLGEIPLNIQLRIRGDEGRVGSSLQDEASAPYLEAICHNLVRNLAAARKAQPADAVAAGPGRLGREVVTPLSQKSLEPPRHGPGRLFLVVAQSGTLAALGHLFHKSADKRPPHQSRRSVVPGDVTSSWPSSSWPSSSPS